MNFAGRWITMGGYRAVVAKFLPDVSMWIGHIILPDLGNIPTYWDHEGNNDNVEFSLGDRIREAEVGERVFDSRGVVSDRKRISPPRISRD